MRFSEEHRTNGRFLQEDLAGFERELSEALDELWRKSDDPAAERVSDASTWALRME